MDQIVAWVWLKLGAILGEGLAAGIVAAIVMLIWALRWMRRNWIDPFRTHAQTLEGEMREVRTAVAAVSEELHSWRSLVGSQLLAVMRRLGFIEGRLGIEPRNGSREDAEERLERAAAEDKGA